MILILHPKGAGTTGRNFMPIALHSTKEVAGILAFLLSFSVPSIVQAAERGFINPRVLGEGILPQGLSPPSLRALPHEKQLDLNIVYTDGQIYNPATAHSTGLG
jgi:hypothetical protein